MSGAPGVAEPIHHWTTPRQAIAALSTGVMRARRWRHHLEDGDRFASGTSWSRDPLRWRAGHSVRLTVDPTHVSNRIHAIPASRTYWRTLGLLVAEADPDAWTSEPTEPDEEFVEGAIRGFGERLLAVMLTGAVPVADRERIAMLLRACRPDLTVDEPDDAPELSP